MASNSRTAIIAGAGIAGLSSAIALTLAGWKVRVFESAPKLEEVGAGLQISPNGVKLLKIWGVYEQLLKTAVFPKNVEMTLAKSRLKVFELPLGDYALKRWGGEYIHIHRADLHSELLKKLTELAGDIVHLGRKVVQYENTTSGVCVSLENGQKFDADLLIGSDGLHSNIRAQMHPDLTPKYTGNYAWRAIIPTKVLANDLPPKIAKIWAMSGKHAVTTRIRNGELVNFVGVVESDEIVTGNWFNEGKAREAIDDFGHIPELRDLIECAGDIRRWGLYEHEPLPFWSKGCVVVVGDAAHPMLPSMAQGAVQSMEDAQILADTLSYKADIALACNDFYARRIHRVSKIQKLSAQNLRLFHRKSIFAKVLTYTPMWVCSKIFPSVLQMRTDWIYGYKSDE